MDRSLPPRERPVAVRMPPFGLFAASSRHGRRFQMPFETRAFDKLLLVGTGQSAVDHAGGSVPLEEGDLVLVPAGVRHRVRDQPGAPVTLHLVCVDWQRCRPGLAATRGYRDLVRRLGRLRACRVRDPYARAEVARRVQSLVFEQTRRRPGFALAVEAGFMQILVTLLRGLAAPARPGKGSRRGADRAGFRAALAHVEEHFREPLRIPLLAAQAGMSYRSFTAHFRQEVGRSFAAHVARLRVAYARDRLRAGATILDAALDAGFPDLSNFYRVFRRLTGTTPGRMRGEA